MFTPKRFFNFAPPFNIGVGLLPAGFRVNPAQHALIRNPVEGIPKNFLAEAKRAGKYKELILDMPTTDPRHPYYTEYLWTTYANADIEHLTPEQKYQAWYARNYRFHGGWCKVGCLYEDGENANNLWWLTREAFERLPANVVTAREQRLDIARDSWRLGEILPLEERPTAVQDVAYLMPAMRQVLDEWHEANSCV